MNCFKGGQTLISKLFSRNSLPQLSDDDDDHRIRHRDELNQTSTSPTMNRRVAAAAIDSDPEDNTTTRRVSLSAQVRHAFQTQRSTSSANSTASDIDDDPFNETTYLQQYVKRDYSHLNSDHAPSRFTPVRWSDSEDDQSSFGQRSSERAMSRLDPIADQDESGRSRPITPEHQKNGATHSSAENGPNLSHSTSGQHLLINSNENGVAHESKSVKKPSDRLRSILDFVKQRSKVIAAVIAVIISIITAMYGTGPLGRYTSPPSKFFDPKTSMVTDYEFGEINKFTLRALESDVSFVMYYSPKDPECLRFRKEYETVIKHYNQQIYFAAINCKWPYGECASSMKIKKFPKFVSYLRTGYEVEYRGPLVTSYIISFLDNLLDPVIPLQSDTDLLELRSKHDAVAVGYYDMQESSQNYQSFLKAAIMSLTTDPWRRVQYAVITSKKVANRLKIISPSSLILYRWNSTFDFPAQGKFVKSEAIKSWVYDTLFKSGSLVDWSSQSDTTLDISKVNLGRTPATFILFTPRSLILGISPYFDVLREVAMDYYNCDNAMMPKTLVHRSILRRRLMEETLLELEEKCHEAQRPKKDEIVSQAFDGNKCCHSQSVRWRPISKTVDKKCFCTACITVMKAKCPGGCKRFNCLATASRYLSTFEPNTVVNSSATYCNQLKTTYKPKMSPYYKVSVTCSGVTPSGIDFENEIKLSSSSDDVSDANLATSQAETFSAGLSGPSQPRRDEKIERMIASFESQYCSRLHLGLNHSDLNFPDSGEGAGALQQFWRRHFTGLACATNKTLSFVAIDSTLYPMYAERLGLDVFNETHSTVSVIVEPANENVYVLNHGLAAATIGSETATINKRTIYEFIKNYTAGTLPRYVRSSTSTSSSEQCLTRSDGITNIVCVPELTSDSFNTIVLKQKKKDVVLFYYTPWCGFCSSIASVYLKVAQFFGGIDELIFARINADKHSLPFEYTTDRYPTIALFQAENKAESILYPFDKPITVNNLIRFILANVQQRNVRWLATFQLCSNKQCLRDNLMSTTNHIRRLQRLIKFQTLTIYKLTNLLENGILSSRQEKDIKQYLQNLRHKDIRYLRHKLKLLSRLRHVFVDRLQRAVRYEEDVSNELQLDNELVSILSKIIDEWRPITKKKALPQQQKIVKSFQKPKVTNLPASSAIKKPAANKQPTQPASKQTPSVKPLNKPSTVPVTPQSKTIKKTPESVDLKSKPKKKQ